VFRLFVWQNAVVRVLRGSFSRARVTTPPTDSAQVSVSLTSVKLAFSALTLLVGRQEGHPACKKTEWWGAGVVFCPERGADLHIWPS